MSEPLSEARLAEIRTMLCVWCHFDPFVPEGQHRRGCPFGDLLAAYDAQAKEIARLREFIDFTVRGWLLEDEHAHCEAMECRHARDLGRKYDALNTLFAPEPQPEGGKNGQ